MRRSSLPHGSEERRGLTLAEAGCQLRADGDGNQRFAGHAAVFDQRTAIGNPLTWGFYEQISPGAFTKTLSEGDARFLIDHDSYYVVSRVSADTLDLAQDKTGLATDSALDNDLSYVRDLSANLRNGNITGMSFGFYVVKADWSEEDVSTTDGQSTSVEVRTIREVNLIEVSAVTFPAYEGTDAGLRSQVSRALRSRGDVDAVARRARHSDEFAALLSEMRPEPRATTIDLGRSGNKPSDDENRKAVSSHSTATDDGAWNGPANEKNLPADDASANRACFAWQDPDGDAEKKSTWKFPHHFVDSDGNVGAASTKACTTGIAVLNGGMGGSGIPDADRSGVHAHLARHLKDAGIDAPELKSAEAAAAVAAVVADARAAHDGPAGDVNTPPDQSSTEPAETTRDLDSTTDDAGEPAETTHRHAPSLAELNRARAKRFGLRPAA